MSNIFLLHSLNRDTLEFWGEDLKQYAKDKSWKIFTPEFPIRAESSFEKFNSILKKHLQDGTLNNDSIVIAHSIGNPYFIKFCRVNNYIPRHYIAVAPGASYEYPSTRNDYIVNVKKQSYLIPEDISFGKNIKSIYLLYSDEDDGNLEKFTRFEKDFNTKSMYLKGYSHFDGRHRIYKIPELNLLIENLMNN